MHSKWRRVTLCLILSPYHYSDRTEWAQLMSVRHSIAWSAIKGHILRPIPQVVILCHSIMINGVHIHQLFSNIQHHLYTKTIIHAVLNLNRFKETVISVFRQTFMFKLPWFLLILLIFVKPFISLFIYLSLEWLIHVAKSMILHVGSKLKECVCVGGG